MSVNDLARRLFEEYRVGGGAFWNELSEQEQQKWRRVARHVETRTNAVAKFAFDQGTAGGE